ncbi:threonine synthase [Alkalihalobacillus pseudalcaliphilus]|uniref:threonine synthase n=1 Tax=Alkalihalobacillus pseudalcaliphilus TaxID=79884 RepID=UPI00064E0AEB|nr:threonine synthase [Alkalihalobacillus pseudalcaliphilus]KMK76869.1 threonine synthase [Alkalihalobacillus pseudalcaliphilus]
MTFSYVSHLFCPKCSLTCSSDQVRNLCVCGSPLLVSYHYPKMKEELSHDILKDRQPTLWRYHELLPIKNPDYITSMGEGMTPIVAMNRYGQKLGIQHLWMKDEGLLPTGSFKARGAAVGVSKAKELGLSEIAMPTNGNAGAAWALYAARAGLKSHIVMPLDAPLITRNEVSISGANLYLMDGLISDAGKVVAESVQGKDWFDVSTLKEPYRIEGKKTMGFEIAEQFDWQVPDVILYPTGGGVGLIGIYKAFKELIEIGWLEQDKLPRLVAVQAKGCAPIVKAFENNQEESEMWPNASTAAFGINVPKALGDFLILEAIYETNGTAIAIEDGEISAEQKEIAELEGAFICPEGAATFAAVKKLRANNWIQAQEKVVCLNTGMGIKYPESVNVLAPTLEVGEHL